MYVFRNLSPKIIFNFAWKPLLTYALYGTGIYFLFHWLEHLEIDATIPFLPLSTIGIAVAFYVGFKNNQAYDRFWEGRKIWGGIVNTGVGDGSEDPFENFINDVPMTALCRTIEIDLREMLGETDLPERIKPIDGVLL
jgi:predicted membrane chloride channel (bestrophin family)